MPRTPRLVYPECPHHVVQRGNRRQQVFFEDADYNLYLAMATRAFREADVEAWAYCLMPNHVHLIATPKSAEGLAKAMAGLNRRYARYINEKHGWTGYFWQSRFASFPMDDGYLRHCLRYVAFNPVRAGLVSRPENWKWSSARAYLTRCRHPLLTPGHVLAKFPELENLFRIDAPEKAIEALRSATGSGAPLGAADWLRQFEAGEKGDTRSHRTDRQDGFAAVNECASPAEWQKGRRFPSGPSPSPVRR